MAHPFDDWDFASCTSLPLLAPPHHRYNRIVRKDALFAESERYMDELTTAPSPPAPLPSLQPTLARFANILVIRRINRPFADPRPRLVYRNAELLLYEISPTALR